MIDIKRVGEKIKTYRNNMGMTQDELARKLFVTRQAISNREKGIAMPSIDNVVSLAELFPVPIGILLSLKRDKHE
jgi:DNA-binding XRE family transcriptional regulator